MKSLRKSFAFLVVLAIVLSTVAPVFAATPTDVVGTDYEAAVGKLVALGIVQGYEDGTFKPEQNITRAEFSKIACYVIGVQTAAELSKGTTKFKDVPATHWASGYINIASENALIKGYPDGTFKPEANVSYAEAITILVRALGLGPVVEGKGTWPSNYLSKASEAKVTEDVSGIAGNVNALRGVIGQLSWNTLKAEKWGEKEYTADGITYGPLGKSLLKEKYSDFVKANGDPKFYEDAVVTATPFVGNLENNKITVEKESIGTEIDGTANDNDTTKEVTQTGVDFYGLLGKKVDVLFGKDNKIVFIMEKAADSKTGTVNLIDYKDGSDSHNGKVTIDGVTYSLAKQAKLYVNTKDYSATGTDAVKDTNLGGATDGLDYVRTDVIQDRACTATAVLNDDGLVSTLNFFVADVMTGAVGLPTMKQFVVKEVLSDTSVIDVKDKTSQFKISEVEDANKVNGYKTVFVKNGKVVKGSEIKAGDTVTYVNNDKVYYVVITDTKVTGTVTNVATDDQPYANGKQRYKLTVGGKEYKMTRDGSVNMTRTGNIADKEDITDDSVKDFLNKEATLTLNSLGQIVFVSGNVKTSTGAQYGIVKEAPYNGTDSGEVVKYIKIKTSEGTEKTFIIKDTSDSNPKVYLTDGTSNQNTTAWDDGAATPTSYFPAGTLVQYKVETDGKIKAANLVKVDVGSTYTIPNAGSDNSVAVKAAVADIKDDAMVIQVGANYYYATSSTVILNQNTSNIEKVVWSQLVSGDGTTTNILDNSATGGLTIIYDTNNRTVKYLVGSWLSSAYLTSDNKFAIYKEVKYNADGDKIIVLNVAGTDKEYEVSTDVYDTVFGTAYKATVSPGDLIKYDLADDKFVGGKAIDLNLDGDTLDPNEISLVDSKYANFRFDAAYAKVYYDSLPEYKTQKIYSVDTASNLLSYYTESGTQGTTYKLGTDVVVYDVRDTSNIKTMALSELQSGMYAYIDYLKDGVYKVLVVWK